MKFEKLEVSMKLTLRDDLEGGEKYGKFHYYAHMGERGTKVIIKKIDNKDNSIWDGDSWYSFEMFKESQEPETPKEMLIRLAKDNIIIVEFNNGEMAIYSHGKLFFKDGWDDISELNDDLEYSKFDCYSVKCIYKDDYNLGDSTGWYFEIESCFNLTKLWECKSEQQLKIEELEKQKLEIEKQIEELRGE